MGVEQKMEGNRNYTAYMYSHICMYVCMYVCVYIYTYLRIYEIGLDERRERIIRNDISLVIIIIVMYV